MKKRWFTLIEIMIAITVFSIGVLAVLRLITSNLVTMDKVENRTVATFLAKEWLELVYNIRDANDQKWLPWDCLLADSIEVNTGGMNTNDLDLIKACSRYFSSGASDGNVLSIGFAESGYFFATQKRLEGNFLVNFSTFGLVKMTWMVGQQAFSRYGPRQENNTWGLQIFGRYILFTGVRDWENILPLTDILKVESHVLFMKWANTWEIVLESFIWKQ